LALGSATWVAPPPTIAPVAAIALSLARAIRIDMGRALSLRLSGADAGDDRRNLPVRWPGKATHAAPAIAFTAKSPRKSAICRDS